MTLSTSIASLQCKMSGQGARVLLRGQQPVRQRHGALDSLLGITEVGTAVNSTARPLAIACGGLCSRLMRPVATICRIAARNANTPHAALQCGAGTSDKIRMQHSNGDSPFRAAPKAGSIRVPLAVLDHLPRLHGAEFKVLLVLGRHQARGGGRDQKPFSYSIPQIQKDTGLCPRAISQAISRLDKHHLILRVANHGALPNRYRVLLEPAALPKTPVAKESAW